MTKSKLNQLVENKESYEFNNGDFTVTFNKSLGEDRPKDELIKSVSIQPNDWAEGGKILTRSNNFFWRRGSLNAIWRVMAQMDDITKDYHLYKNRKESGMVGYAHASIIPSLEGPKTFFADVPGFGRMMVKKPIMVSGQNEDGKKIFEAGIRSIWLELHVMSPSLAELKAGVFDKNGNCVSDILHENIAAINEGYRIIVDTTWHFNRNTGEFETHIHNKALTLKNDVQKSPEQLATEALQRGIERKENKKAHAQAHNEPVIEEKGQQREEAKNIGRTFTLEGKNIALSEIPSNTYTLKVDGKVVRASYRLLNEANVRSLKYLNIQSENDNIEIELVPLH